MAGGGGRSLAEKVEMNLGELFNTIYTTYMCKKLVYGAGKRRCKLMAYGTDVRRWCMVIV